MSTWDSISPFVKWVGGKSKVNNKYLKNYFPREYKNYIEPFVGGGAILFYLKPKKAIINDTNKELITTYKTIKSKPKKMISILNKHWENHSKEYFYEMRNLHFKKMEEVAARFIYLNKTCFNGMYRVNKNEKFNVPFNNKNKEKLNLYNEENILNISRYLKNNEISIMNKDFEEIAIMAKRDDFIFCDPPYDYDVKNGFDSYTKDPFGKEGQKRLFKTLDFLDKKGVKWMMTNHNTKLIRELYKNYKIIEIKTNRNINSKGSGRKNTGNEVVVINYDR